MKDINSVENEIKIELPYNQEKMALREILSLLQRYFKVDAHNRLLVYDDYYDSADRFLYHHDMSYRVRYSPNKEKKDYSVNFKCGEAYGESDDWLISRREYISHIPGDNPLSAECGANRACRYLFQADNLNDVLKSCYTLCSYRNTYLLSNLKNSITGEKYSYGVAFFDRCINLNTQEEVYFFELETINANLSCGLIHTLKEITDYLRRQNYNITDMNKYKRMNGLIQ